MHHTSRYGTSDLVTPMDERVERAARVLRDAVERRTFPAAVAEVGHSNGVLWQEAFGRLTFDDGSPRAELDTIFDLASLTKPIATASAVLQLVSDGRLRLDDGPSRYCPEWIGGDRSLVTIRHLLEHSSGLSARLHDRPPDTRRAFEHDICTMPLEYPPGSKAIYSDLGFILLGFCVETAGEASLASLTAAVLDAVAQAGSGKGADAGLLVRVPQHARGRTAPTTPLPEDPHRGRHLIGEVHDNYAAALGGFAGHAGLFGSGPGVGVFARTILRAALGMSSVDPFTPDSVAAMVTRSAVAGSSRALGWDTMLPTSSCGTHMSPAAFGHVGFTGTSLWIDPGVGRYYVLLTNRVCDGGTSEDMQVVRRAFHNALTHP